MLSSLLAAADNPMGHVLDRPGILGPFSMNTLTLVIVTFIYVWFMIQIAKAIATGPASDGNERYITKGRFAQMVEVIILYLRDQIIRPQLGHATDKFLPFLLTVFFFVLFNNLTGLIPLLDLQHLVGSFFGEPHFAVIGGTPTGRVAVNAALALVAFAVWTIFGLQQNGVVGFAKHLTAGTPWFIWPIIVPVEFASMFIKAGALCIRLFANMTAGHILLAVLIIFTAAAPRAVGIAGGAPVAIISAVGAVGILFLELFVAFLQAFIFMFLTTIFIAQMAHHEHDDHAMAEDYDEEHPMMHDTTVPVSVA